MEYKKRLNYLKLGDTVVRLSSGQGLVHECIIRDKEVLAMLRDYYRGRILLTEKKYIKINNWDNTINVLENPKNPRAQRIHYFNSNIQI